MGKRRTLPPLWLLGIASSLSPFGMSIVVPALTNIARRFDADFVAVQFVISAYLFGLALAQPACGFFCDRYGRRPVMLAGFGVFVVASLLCAVAPSLELLIGARFLQAVGVSVGTVASRAILRDTYDRNRMAEAMSYIAAAMGLAPILAPVFGGTLTASLGYAWLFIGSAGIGALVLVHMSLSLSETLPTGTTPPRPRDWLASYRYLLRSRSFVGNTLAFGFVQASFFSFMSIGAPLFEERFGVNAGQFGLLWSLMALHYVVGATLAARLTPIIGTFRLTRATVSLAVVAGALAWAGSAMGELTVLKILVPLGLMMLLAGPTTPATMAGAVADHPTIAGTASGLSSAIGLVVAGSFSIIAGVVYDGDYATIGLIIFLTSLATAACWWLSVSAGPRREASQGSA